MNPAIKRLAKYAIYFSPAPLRRYLHRKADAKRIEEALARARRCKVSRDEVAAALDNIDFGHDIMLHTSLMNIGKVAGGPKTVLTEIMERFDSDSHTLVASALPYLGSFSEYLATDPVFDVRSAPIAMGAVNERLAAMPGIYRSLHPTHSVVALGRDAAALTEDHELDRTPFGIHSPYRKLIDRGAHALLFGATVNNMTFIHAVEDALGDSLPQKVYGKRFEARCIDADGQALTVSTPVHAPLFSIRRDLSFFEPDGLELGYIRRFPLGEGFVYDVDMKALARRYVELLHEGRSIYGRCRRMDASVASPF